MQNRIIQWYCRGLKASYEETLLLHKDYEPAALCLQETHLKDTDNVAIRNYSAFHAFSADNERAAGGVSIFVNNNALYSHIPLHTNVQAVAVSITLHRVITLYSIYVPPSSRFSAKDLDDLVPQLPSPFILLGDFNSHNILWGSKDINDKGIILIIFTGDNHVTCVQLSKPDVATLSYRRSHYWWHKER